MSLNALLRILSELQSSRPKTSSVFTERPQASRTSDWKKKKEKKDKTFSPFINSDMLWKGKSSRKIFLRRKFFFLMPKRDVRTGATLCGSQQRHSNFPSAGSQPSCSARFYKAGPRHLRARCGCDVYSALSTPEALARWLSDSPHSHGKERTCNLHPGYHLAPGSDQLPRIQVQSQEAQQTPSER